MIHQAYRAIKRAFSVILLSALMAGRAPAAEVAIAIAYTTDIHGAFEPAEYGELRGQGGLFKASTIIRGLRKAHSDLLLVDCGDIIQGSPEAFRTLGRAPLDAARAMGYDMLVVGNHEFDFGAKRLAELYASAGLPVLAANMSSRSGKKPALPNVSPFLVRDVLGVRVAVIGLTHPLIPGWFLPSGLDGLGFERSVSALRAILPSVRAAKPDIIVLAVHQGLRRRADDSANEIGAIARAFPEIDLILGGHTHQAIECERLNGVMYSQAGFLGSHVGLAELTFDTSSRRVVNSRVRLLPADASVPVDAGLKRRFGPLLAETRKELDRKIGSVSASFYPSSPLPGQSAVQTLIARATAEATGADVVFHGALTKAWIGAGAVRMRDLWRIVPYENRIVLLRLTPGELREVLEENCAFLGTQDFRGVLGAAYEVYADRPVGRRVGKVVAASPGQKEHAGRIVVAVNSFDAASAGNRFKTLRAAFERSECRAVETTNETRAVVAGYLARNSPLAPETEEGPMLMPGPE